MVRYRADGRKEKHQATAGTVETKTRWMPDRLEIETDLGQGTKVTHTYALHEADRQLVLTVALAGGSRDRSPASFVYDDATMPQ